MSDYRDYQVESSPSWLRHPVGAAWSYAFGLVKDAFAGAARSAVKLRFVDFAPPDALLSLVRDRNLDLPVVSTDDELRRRIRHAWATWSTAGTKESVLTALSDSGYTGVSIREGTDWGMPHWWWFYVVLAPPFPWGAGSPTESDQKRVCALIHKWQPAHAFLVNIIVLEAGLLWGDRPIWAKCPPWGGTRVTYWTC